METHLRIDRPDETRCGCCTALLASERVFVSGLSVDSGDRADAQFQRVVELVSKTLGTFHASLSDTVRTRTFYTRPQDRPRLCAAHGEFFRSIRPAASLTQVRFLPDGVRVMVEVEAVRGSATSRKIQTLEASEAEQMGCAGIVQVGDELYLSGITAVQPDGSAIAPGDVGAQSREVVARMLSLLGDCGARPEDVVGTRAYTPVAYVKTDTWRARLPLMHPGHPTAADITVEAVGGREVGILIEAEAVIGAAERRRNVNTGRPFEEEHHYSRAVRVGDRVYVSGTTSVQVNETMASPFDAYGQTLRTLKWIRWAVEQQGLPFSDLVRTRSYVVGEENVEPVARGLRETLGAVGPVATVVGVPALGRPGILVEIEATAVRGAGGE